jgi:hypothetical protein
MAVYRSSVGLTAMPVSARIVSGRVVAISIHSASPGVPVGTSG